MARYSWQELLPDASGTVVLVEGISDQAAVDTLAKRLGRDLEKEGVTIVPIGGATKIWPFLEVLGPRGSNVKLAGLYDIGEERHFRRALERAGFGAQAHESGYGIAWVLCLRCRPGG